MAAKPIKVTTRETPELHAFRARYAQLTRKLPKKFQGPLFAHIIMTDCRTYDRWYSKEVMVAYSAKIAPKYKMPVATMADIKRYNPQFVELGYITREHRGEADWGRDGKLRWQQKENRYIIHVDVLESLAQQGIQAKSEPLTAPLTAPPTAPYIVSKETESRSSGTENRLATAHHQPDASRAKARSASDDGALPTSKNRAKGSTRSGENEFFSWLSDVLGVPQSSITRKVILARLEEVEEDFPGFDWSRLVDYPRLAGYRNGTNPIGAFYTDLPRIVQWLVDADRAEREEADRRAEAARLKEESRGYLESIAVWPEGFDPDNWKGWDAENYTGPAWHRPDKGWTVGVPELGWFRVEITNGRSDYKDRMYRGTLPGTKVTYPPALRLVPAENEAAA